MAREGAWSQSHGGSIFRRARKSILQSQLDHWRSGAWNPPWSKPGSPMAPWPSSPFTMNPSHPHSLCCSELCFPGKKKKMFLLDLKGTGRGIQGANAEVGQLRGRKMTEGRAGMCLEVANPFPLTSLRPSQRFGTLRRITVVGPGASNGLQLLGVVKGLLMAVFPLAGLTTEVSNSAP